MIQDNGKLIVTQGVEYLSQWTDAFGNYEIERYIPHPGRYIVNKVVTGCGFTSYSLCNTEDTILVSPRLRLIQNKMEQLNEKEEICFYYNREINPSTKKPLWDVQVLENQFSVYVNERRMRGKPLKILVTYDSFSNLCDMLEYKFCMSTNAFRIVVDESHSIIKDVKMKEFNNKPVLLNFLHRLFQYDSLLFISATPMQKYFMNIPEFRDNDVYYYELQWSNVAQMIQLPPRGCRNSLDAFDKIYKDYANNIAPNGTHYFDVIYGGSCAYSYDAVIFLNSVKDIRRIFEKYNRLGLIHPGDVTVICAEKPENAAIISKVGLTICRSIPKLGERHTTWTFVTRTAFEGVDFYSPCASTFVIANYNVESLSLDIATDIPQIVGRQRLKSNPFRSTIHIFYTSNLQFTSPEELRQEQENKRRESMKRISNWEAATYKDIALADLTDAIERNPNKLYLRTINGFPEVDELIPLSEQYCMDILVNHRQWFILEAPACKVAYSPQIEELRLCLRGIVSQKRTMDRIKVVCAFLAQNPSLNEAVMLMLHNEGYNNLAYYLNTLPQSRIEANGFDSSKMDQEIAANNMINNLRIMNGIQHMFICGMVYNKRDVKCMLQKFYDANGIRKKAKSTDLCELGVQCCEVKDGTGKKSWKIVGYK